MVSNCPFCYHGPYCPSVKLPKNRKFDVDIFFLEITNELSLEEQKLRLRNPAPPLHQIKIYIYILFLYYTLPIIIRNKWHISENRNLGCKRQYYKKYWLLANFDFWLFSIAVHLGMSNRDRRKAILTAPGDLKLSFRLQRKNNNDTDLKVRSCLKNDQTILKSRLCPLKEYL